MSFPLARWIDERRGLRHNLGVSGMVGQLRTLERAVRGKSSVDDGRLRELIGRRHGVASDRVFLTHGGAEGDSLSLLFLSRHLAAGTRPTYWSPTPEYPPLMDTAELAGFQRATVAEGADLVVFSSPTNPTGEIPPGGELRSRIDAGTRVLVDETFREFTPTPSLSRKRLPHLWTVGSFTKVFGADRFRLGYVIPGELDVDAFTRFHGLVLDQIPADSVAAGIRILEHAGSILSEARGIFRRNLSCLRRHVPHVGPLSAPLWFDRGDGAFDGDGFGDAAARRSVLVCPGSFFRDPGGVRVTLTRRSFPVDLEAYLAVREEWLAPGGRTRITRRGVSGRSRGVRSGTVAGR